MAILTATEIKRRNKEYFDNPSPILKHNMRLIENVQKALFEPLIKRAKELLKN